MPKRVRTWNTIHSSLDAVRTKSSCGRSMYPGVWCLQSGPRYMVPHMFKMTVDHAAAKGGEGLKNIGHERIKFVIRYVRKSSWGRAVDARYWTILMLVVNINRFCRLDKPQLESAAADGAGVAIKNRGKLRWATILKCCGKEIGINMYLRPTRFRGMQ